MVTADRRWWRAALPFVGLVAGGIAFTLLRDSDVAEPADAGLATEASPLAVDAASTFQFASLDEMLVASDTVVVGVVEAISRGRLVGDPDSGGVVSRVVTVRVEQVVWAPSSTIADVVLVEEEGWLTDGTPIEVNGVHASRAGDRGLWFLDQVGVDDITSMVVINSQGRFLEAADGSGGTVGGDQRDQLVQVLQARPFDQLVTLAVAVAKDH